MSGPDTQLSGWQLGGDAPVAYDKYIVNVFMQNFSRRLVTLADMEPGGRVLDIACGTGVVTRLAAERVGPDGQVVGLDVNADMLLRARSLVEGGSNIAWHQGSVADMPFSGASFDVVLCQQGLQFFPERAAALANMYRVLVPGGRLLASVWRSLERCPWQQAVANAVERQLGSEPAQQIRAAFSLADAGRLHRKLLTAGFLDVDIHVDTDVIRHPSLEEFLPGYLAATPVAAEVAGLSLDAQREIVADVRDELFDYLVDDGLAVPIETHIALASR